MKSKRLNILLKETRERQRLRQTEVALKVGLSTAQYISNVERGVCAPSLELLGKLMRIYGLDSKKIAELMIEDYRKSIMSHFKIKDLKYKK